MLELEFRISHRIRVRVRVRALVRIRVGRWMNLKAVFALEGG